MAHNGEFYDFQRIRADLTARVRFRSKSDSEIRCGCIQRQGLAQTLPLLRGEFAFALFDRDEDCLYVADRFGIKPLYWTLTPEGLVFAQSSRCCLPIRRWNGASHQMVCSIS